MLSKRVAICGVDIEADPVKGLRVAGLLNLGYYQALFFALVRHRFYGL